MSGSTRNSKVGTSTSQQRANSATRNPKVTPSRENSKAANKKPPISISKENKEKSCSSTRNKQVKPGQKISEQTFLFM